MEMVRESNKNDLGMKERKRKKKKKGFLLTFASFKDINDSFPEVWRIVPRSQLPSGS